jgi:N-acetylmuramoyl-L-alanine amidase
MKKSAPLTKDSRTNLNTAFFSFSEKLSILCKVIGFNANKRKIVKLISTISLLLSITLLTSFEAPRRVDFKVRKVVIDAGHGGKDSGTLGAVSKEKDVALKIALKVGSYIQEFLPDVQVIYTRRDDRFLELRDRAALANKNGADVFISIHANAIETNRLNVLGTETYVMGLHKAQSNLDVAKRENSVILLEENYEEKYAGFDPSSDESMIMFQLYQSAYQANSLLLADKIENQFKTRAGRRSRGVKQAGFLVLWATSMPSVLVEVGYLSNPTEEKDLNDPSIQGNIASGIFRAFREYKEQVEAIR